MTRAQQTKEIGELFLEVCNLACERRPPPFKPYVTNLQGASLQLQRFATRCRDHLIDPVLALRQAAVLLREQPIRTAEDYEREAKSEAEKARPGVSSRDDCDISQVLPDNADGTGAGPGSTG